MNQRNDFLHKLSRFYTDNHDLIAIEDLNIKGIAKNHNLAQRILDASWGKFFQMLSYKAERAGRTLVRVNPRGTSQEYKYGELDRDYNAALNILERGLEKVGKVGSGRPEPIQTPVKPVNEAGSPCESWGSSQL